MDYATSYVTDRVSGGSSAPMNGSGELSSLTSLVDGYV